MKNFIIRKSKLSGMVVIPPSKSQTMRSILFAVMAKGKSIINNYLDSPDTNAMIEACRSLGAEIEKKENFLEIIGNSAIVKPAKDVIDAKNSGQLFRFITAICSLAKGYSIITGDESIKKRRPIKPLLKALSDLKAFSILTNENSNAPLIIKGPITSGIVEIDGEDSQPVSALIIASSFIEGKTTIIIKNPKEKPWINMTLSWLDRLNIRYENYDFEKIIVHGANVYSGFNYIVPTDMSTLLFPIVAALTTDSEITINDIVFDEMQGDFKIIELLRSMGANIEILKDKIIVKKSKMEGRKIDIDNYIDALPALAVLGTAIESPLEITNAKIARKKESDRIRAIVEELRKMNAKIEERDDGIVIYPSKLNGANLYSHLDHRLAMALSIAALTADGESIVANINSISKTYKNFKNDLQKLGANIL